MNKPPNKARTATRNVGTRRRERRRQIYEQQQRRKRRRQRSFVVLVLAIVAIMVCLCRCDPPSSAPSPLESGADDPGTEADTETDTGVTRQPQAHTGRVPYRGRPTFPAVQPTPVTWLSAFRMQVSARSTRLAACFVDADQPGKLTWTSTVNATSGQVANSDVEPFLDSDELSMAERTCVMEVLSSPPYALPSGGPATERVSLIIEF